MPLYIFSGSEMKIDANSIRVGNVLVYEGKLWVVLKTMHTQPGKGGAYMQVEMKEIKAGTKTNVRFRSSETVEKAHLESASYQFLYTEGTEIALMDKTSFEQISISKEMLGAQLPFLQDGMELTVELYNNTPVLVKLPDTVTEKVVECEAVIKGQTAASSYKPAVLSNGVRVMVPPFIEIGAEIIIKVETQEYMERAK